MKLGKKQELFARLLPRLLDKAEELGRKNGFSIRLGDLFRDPRVHGVFGEKMGYGHKNSVHKLKLAQDINMVSDDGKLIEDSEAHRELGEWWIQQGEFCRWGGNFKRPDGNHYSLTHWGAM